MADNTKIWSLIHAERRKVADTIEGLSPEQWTHASLVNGWSVGQLAGHMLRAAEQTPGRFLKQMARSGFRFDKSMDDTARASDLDKDEIVSRMRQRLTTSEARSGSPACVWSRPTQGGRTATGQRSAARDCPCCLPRPGGRPGWTISPVME